MKKPGKNMWKNNNNLHQVDIKSKDRKADIKLTVGTKQNITLQFVEGHLF